MEFWDKRITLSIKLKIVPFLCVKGYWENKNSETALRKLVYKM